MGTIVFNIFSFFLWMNCTVWCCVTLVLNIMWFVCTCVRFCACVHVCKYECFLQYNPPLPAFHTPNNTYTFYIITLKTVLAILSGKVLFFLHVINDFSSNCDTQSSASSSVVMGIRIVATNLLAFVPSSYLHTCEEFRRKKM